MFIHLNKRGQSTLEYAVIIAVVAAVLISMQVYIKRGLQGKIKQSTDDIGEQFSADHTTVNVVYSINSFSNEHITGGNNTSTSTYSNQQQDRTVNETVAKSDKETWK